jgi:hypothetical protein
MMRNEDHAKLTLCHRTMAPRYADSFATSPLPCCGSECMAWRWARSQDEAVATPDTLHPADAKQGNKMTPTPPEGPGWEYVGPYEGTPGWSLFRRLLPTDRGYCGLAGPAT